MKLIEYFGDFLKNEVNLNRSRVDFLDDRVVSITNFLKGGLQFKDNFVGTVPQGSYAHKTIIKPARANKEFDADLLLHLEEFADWSASDYVENLYKMFRESGTYKDMVSRRTRCVVVNYAGDFHLDVVPYLERHGSFYITDRHENAFELTAPEAFTAWLDDKNRVTTGNHFLKVVRLIKYLRDTKQTFSVKSVILTTLLGDRVDSGHLLADPACYTDVPTTLRSVMTGLNEYLQSCPIMPVIEDPGGTGENFSQRWDQDQYANFRDKMKFYAEKIEDAYSEPNKDASLKKWQGIFGPEFKAPQLIQAAVTFVRPESAPTSEQFLPQLGIQMRLNAAYRVRISGRVLPMPGFNSYYLRDRANKVRAHRRIEFSLQECNVPEPFTVKWKVRNSGAEAIARECLRGEISNDFGSHTKIEPTAFRGNHYVECYVIRNGECVAKDRQPVVIE